MTSAELGGILVALLFGVCVAAAYVLYRMTEEGVDAVRRFVRWLRGKRRGDRH